MELLFSLPNLRRVGITKYVRYWFDLAKRYEPVIDLYLGTIYNSAAFVEFKFLALTQALESFHRRRYRGRYVPAAKYQAYTAAMLGAMDPAMPETLKTKLRDVLRFGNEHSQRKRFRRILDELGDSTYSLVSSEERKTFANKIVDTRNYLTHYPTGGSRPPFAGIELHRTNQRLQVLLLILLLRELGLEEPLIAGRIREHPRLGAMAAPRVPAAKPAANPSSAITGRVDRRRKDPRS
jgi:hypothetical protein